MARRRRKSERRREDRERTAVERLMDIFEVLPGLYSEQNLFPLMPEEDGYVRLLLKRLAERKVLQREIVDGVPAYWDPAHGFDPRRGVLRSLGLLPLDFPLNRAVRRARAALARGLLRYREELGARVFHYTPLWRVPAEVDRGGARLGRDFYVHGGNRKLAVLEAGRLVFRDVVRGSAWRIPTLLSPGRIDRVPPERVREEIHVVRVAPAEAAAIVRQMIGARPNATRVELCLLPVFRFDVKPRGGSRRTRHVWVDGTFGSVIR